MSVFKHSRIIPATPEQVFAAFSDPKRLARWWGPKDFKNTFDVFEFREGGHWSFIMHGPEGTNYPNESEFVSIQPPKRVVIRHICEPKFLLSIDLSTSSEGTLVSWLGEFENPEFANKLRDFLNTANEQNLDRLTMEVLRGSGMANP